MRITEKSSDLARTHPFTDHRLLRWLVLGVLFAGALSVRLHGIGDLPLDFHPTRQYRSAIIARAYYYESSAPAATWQRRVAAENAAKEGRLEPALMERVSALLYRVAGSEQLWIPRMLSIGFWLTGGWLLYLLAARLVSRDGAIVSTACYLFLSFGISASRSFQPDPLMVLAALAALYFMVRHHLAGTTAWLAAAATTAGLAILVKPTCLFVLLGVFCTLAWSRLRFACLRSPAVYGFACVALLPGAAYYIPGLIGGGPLGSQASGSVLPQLLVTAVFWRGWAYQVLSVIGVLGLAAGILGVLLLEGRWQRALVLGLWGGYGVSGLVFTYHIHTHDYYHLLLIPIATLSFAPVGALLLGALARHEPIRITRLVVFGLTAFILLVHVERYLDRHPRLDTRRWEEELAGEVGEVVGHSTNTVILAPHYGMPLKYHGEIGGEVWPDSNEQRARLSRGVARVGAAERLRAMERGGRRDFFIVTWPDELKRQRDLRELLSGYPIAAVTARYVVFDLRERDPGEPRSR